MKRWTVLCLAGALVLTGCDDPDDASGSLAPSVGTAAIGVSTGADGGPGSLRAALAAAELDPSITRVRITPGIGPIALASPLTFGGPQALTLHANGAVIDAAGLDGTASAALLVSGAAGFSIRDLTITNSPGTGLTVQVRPGATGTFTVELERLTALNNGLHGVLVNDQAGYLEDPESTSPEGSPAGLIVRVKTSRFEANGFAAADQDGLRVNEGGEGSLDFLALGSTFEGNGADGLELDERAAGDAVLTIQQTAFEANGFRVNDPLDFDDGLDVDEAGDGALIARIVQATASDNAEEGMDLNENDAGDLRVEMTDVTADGNTEEGVDLEEDDDVVGGGDLVADLRRVTASGNGSAGGDAGLKLRERGGGDIRSRIVNPTASRNQSDGIQLREQDAGRVDAQLVSATVSANIGNGVRLRGDGQALVQSLTADGNGLLRLTADPDIVVTELPAALMAP